MKTKLLVHTVAFGIIPMVMNHSIALAEDKPISVTVDNFPRAETDLYFSRTVQDSGGIGKFSHHREMIPIDKQSVIRTNRDTLYSAAVADLDAGPVTITLPDAGKRFRSMMVLNEDQYVVGPVIYDAGEYTYDKQKVGTRYVFIALRTLVDPNDPKDLGQVHALQDASKIKEAAPGKFEVPSWDPVSQKKVRDALLVLSSTASGFQNAFGSKDEVDPIRHLLGTAAGWGGNPDKDAVYVNFTSPNGDGSTPYRLVVKDVPVDGFWSISLYNAEGYFQKNDANAYSVNNITAKKEADGSVVIQFGGDPKAASNYLAIMPGWNYTARLYRPHKEILDGTWKFPEPQPVK